MFSINIEFYGYIAAVLTTIAFLPQLIKTIKTKSANDVSLITLVMFICGLCFWIIYGYQISSIPIMTANIITFLLNLLILISKISYSNKK